MQRVQLNPYPLLIFCALLFLAYMFKGVLIQPPQADPDHPFNTARAYERLQRILGPETPHPVDSDANDAVQTRLLAEIEALGFTPVLSEAPHCRKGWGRISCARLQNIAFWVGDPGPNAVMLLSHYDSVPAGPGASDDGAGLAVSLEIASLLSQTRLTRPLLVLITDGEEVGLLGASYFAEHDPLAKQIAAIVNLEARGVEGQVSFFQSSRPNGRDLAALNVTTNWPAASSMNADIYEMLPNDTDLSVFLESEIDAINLAYIGAPAFYHTPGDNLARLDQNSLFHMGATALAAANGLLAQSGTENEAQYLYIDVLGMYLLVLPIWLGGLLISLTLLLCLFYLMTQRRDGMAWVRPMAFTLFALIVALGLAALVTQGVGALRDEVMFGSAHPFALRGLQVLASMLGALLLYGCISFKTDQDLQFISIWFWFSVIASLSFLWIPGSRIIFAPACLFFSLAILSYLIKLPWLAKVFSAYGILAFAVLVLPLAASGEIALGVESAAPFALFAGLILLLTLPYFWSTPRLTGWSYTLCLVSIGTAIAGFFGTALVVPAYSPQAPRAVSIQHIQGDAYGAPVWRIGGTEAPPGNVRDKFEFGADTLRGSGFIASAPEFEAELMGLSKTFLSENERSYRFQLKLAVPDMDRLILDWPDTVRLETLTFADQSIDFSSFEETRLICHGRSCRILELILSIDKAQMPAKLDLQALYFGLGPKSNQLISSLPDWTLPQHTGDHRRLVTSVRFTREDIAPPAPVDETDDATNDQTGEIDKAEGPSGNVSEDENPDGL